MLLNSTCTRETGLTQSPLGTLQGATVWMVDPLNQDLWAAVSFNLGIPAPSLNDIIHHRIKLGQGIAGDCAVQGKSIAVNDPQNVATHANALRRTLRPSRTVCR